LKQRCSNARSRPEREQQVDTSLFERRRGGRREKVWFVRLVVEKSNEIMTTSADTRGAAGDRPRVCVVMAGQLSTAPRMLKAADALNGAGYRVRVVSTRSGDWTMEADDDARKTRDWPWVVVDYGRRTARWANLRSGLRRRASRVLTRWIGPQRCSLRWAASAYARVHHELVEAALAEPADLYYGGQTGALAAVAVAARRGDTPYAIDLEDFHTAEQSDSPEARFDHALAERIERDILPGAAFLTAGSEAIAGAYTEKYGLAPIPINNTFPLPAVEPDLHPSAEDGLRLYWFSQTVGPGRGLEDAIRAMGLAGIPGTLHLRGSAMAGYVESLRELARESAAQLEIAPHPPAPPDAMIDLCRGYDVGLALEQTDVFNRSICLTNKAFTYMHAGLAVAFTDTPGQRPLALDMGSGALLYTAGDVARLAAGLKEWYEDKDQLKRAKVAAWEAARNRWHWEHAAERGALLAAVAGVIGEPCASC